MSLLILRIQQISNDSQKIKLTHDFYTSARWLVIVHVAFVIFAMSKLTFT